MAVSAEKFKTICDDLNVPDEIKVEREIDAQLEIGASTTVVLRREPLSEAIKLYLLDRYQKVGWKSIAFSSEPAARHGFGAMFINTHITLILYADESGE